MLPWGYMLSSVKTQNYVNCNEINRCKMGELTKLNKTWTKESKEIMRNQGVESLWFCFHQCQKQNILSQ